MQIRIYRYLILVGLWFFFQPVPGQAIMAPHNQSNAISCDDCHLLSEWWGNSPSLTSAYFLKACERCHNNDTGGGFDRDNAPQVQTHSSAVIGDLRYGNWERNCFDCHGHQVSTTPLAAGTFNGYTIINGNTDFYVDVDPAWSADMLTWPEKTGPERGMLFTVRYDDLAAGGKVTDSFEIIDVQADVVTVKGAVKALPDGTPPDGTFEVYYGMFVRQKISGQFPVVFTGPTTFADNDQLGDGQGNTDIDGDGQDDDSTPNGICQVCHTQTLHWRSDGTLAANHNSGLACTECHSHSQGFKPRCDICHGEPPVEATIGVVNSDGSTNGLVYKPLTQGPTGSQTVGAHLIHATSGGYGFSCTNCHYGGMQLDPNVVGTEVIGNQKIQIGFSVNGLDGSGTSYTGQPLTNGYGYEGTNGTTVSVLPAGDPDGLRCSNVYCHSQGKTNAQGFDLPSRSPAWNGSTVDSDGFSCNNCHQYPPSFDAHQRHYALGFGCGLCHAETTPNGTVIADRSLHANGEYDVVPGPQFYARRSWHSLRFTYTWAPGGGTCSNNSCHQYGDIKDPRTWINRPQIIADDNAILTFSQGACEPGAYTGTVAVDVSVNCPDCAEPYLCDFDWGDGQISTDVSCSESHTYTDIVPHTAADGVTVVDPDDTVIGGFDVVWKVRDRFNVTLASGVKTSRVDVCPLPNVPPVEAFSYHRGPAHYEACITDQSYDPDFNLGTHYVSDNPPSYAAPGMVRVDWLDTNPDGSSAFVEQEYLWTDQPQNMEYCHVYSRGGYNGIQHAIKDNHAGSSWVQSPVTVFKIEY